MEHGKWIDDVIARSGDMLIDEEFDSVSDEELPHLAGDREADDVLLLDIAA